MTGQGWTSWPAAEARIECCGDQHRLRWHDGVLDALDHSDLDGERALAALGGERNSCVETLDAWEAHRDDLKVLTLGSRGPRDAVSAGSSPHLRGPMLGRPHSPTATVQIAQVQMPAVTSGSASLGARVVPAIGRHFVGPAGPRLPTQVPEAPLLDLIGLGGGLWDRLVATVLATWSERLAAEDDRIHEARPALAAALFGRVRVALADWLGEPGLRVEVELIGPDEAPELSRTDQGVQAFLPFRWLNDVWAPGFAIVFGHFTLELNQIREQRRLLALSPDFGLRHVTVTIEDAGAASNRT